MPGITDPISGQPASKNVPARVERFVAATYAFAVLRYKPAPLGAEYWAIAKCHGGWRVEMAFAKDPDDWRVFARALLGSASEPIEYQDVQTGRRRFAAYDDGPLTGMLFMAPEPVAASREWAISQLAGTDALLGKRNAVLAGRPGAGVVDRGTTVCACFGVGANEIAAAVRNGCSTLAAVGGLTQAGTNCGSCRPEIKRIIHEHALAKTV